LAKLSAKIAVELKKRTNIGGTAGTASPYRMLENFLEF
jgi:hypothetical protein